MAIHGKVKAFYLSHVAVHIGFYVTLLLKFIGISLRLSVLRRIICPNTYAMGQCNG